MAGNPNTTPELAHASGGAMGKFAAEVTRITLGKLSFDQVAQSGGSKRKRKNRNNTHLATTDEGLAGHVQIVAGTATEASKTEKKKRSMSIIAATDTIIRQELMSSPHPKLHAGHAKAWLKFMSKKMDECAEKGLQTKSYNAAPSPLFPIPKRKIDRLRGAKRGLWIFKHVTPVEALVIASGGSSGGGVAPEVQEAVGVVVAVPAARAAAAVPQPAPGRVAALEEKEEEEDEDNGAKLLMNTASGISDEVAYAVLGRLLVCGNGGLAARGASAGQAWQSSTQVVEHVDRN